MAGVAPPASTATADPRLALAPILLEAGGAVTDPLGHALFPFDLLSYRGEPIPFLAGNPTAHGEAVIACRQNIAAVAEAHHDDGTSRLLCGASAPLNHSSRRN